jgi:hypothetical protein
VTLKPRRDATYPANIKGIGINRALVRRKKGRAAAEVSLRGVQGDGLPTIQAKVDDVNILTRPVAVE